MAEYIEREAVEKMFENASIISDGEYNGYCTEDVYLNDIPAADVAPVAELEKTRRALAYMWFAYRNKDEEFPHDFERKAEKMAEKLLGKWEDCMSELLREENNGLS